MFVWIWRLIVLASFAAACVAGYGWLRSYDRARSAYVVERGRYVQAVTQRGSVLLFWIDDFPAAGDDRPVRGYVERPVDETGKRIEGIAKFELSQSDEREYGPLKLSQGIAESDFKLPEPPAGVVPKKSLMPRGSITIVRKSGADGATSDPVQVSRPAFKYHTLSVPHWLIVSVLALPAALSFLSVFKRMRVRVGRHLRGQCLNCGVDRRGDLGGRCHVCGSKF